jgi:hypothetical protein
MTDPVIQQILDHIAKLNDEYGQISISVAVLKSQMETITWWFRAFGIATMTMLISQIGQLLIMRKNNKK